MANTRFARLLVWLTEHNITFIALGEQLGVSDVYARQLCNRQTIPVARHAQMAALGLPVDMLPEPCSPRIGRPKVVPIFPGLAREMGTTCTDSSLPPQSDN